MYYYLLTILLLCLLTHFKLIEWCSFFQTPIRRRIESVSTFLLMPGGFLFSFIIFTLMMYYYPYIGILYISWVYYDRSTPNNGGRKLQWFCRLFYLKFVKTYFPAKIVYDDEKALFKNNSLNLFCAHPHGIIGGGVWTNIISDYSGFSDKLSKLKNPKKLKTTPLRLCTINVNFLFPIFRDILLSFGLISANRKSIDYCLSQEFGASVILVVGGSEEALHAVPGTADLTILRRKGFVRAAIDNDVKLVPIFTFGENEIYRQLSFSKDSFLFKIQSIFTRIFSFSPPLFMGRGIFQYSFGFMPLRKELITVVGSPVEYPDGYSQMEYTDFVNKYHEKYLEALKDLYSRNVKIYGSDLEKAGPGIRFVG